MCVREMNFHSVDDIEEAVTSSLVSGFGVLVWFGLGQNSKGRKRRQIREERKDGRSDAKCEKLQRHDPKAQNPHASPHTSLHVCHWSMAIYIFSSYIKEFMIYEFNYYYVLIV